MLTKRMEKNSFSSRNKVLIEFRALYSYLRLNKYMPDTSNRGKIEEEEK
jgi:hypothetical protein